METIVTNSIGMVMIFIQSGNFLMGSDNPPAKWDEMPVRKVKISQPFYISETEVTIEQFRQFKSQKVFSTRHPNQIIKAVIGYKSSPTK